MRSEKQKKAGREYYAKNKEEIEQRRGARMQIPENKEKRDAGARQYYLRMKATNPEVVSEWLAKSRIARRMKTYGITRSEYEDIILRQDNKCAICGGLLFGVKIKPHIDHNHKTGSVRGILCQKCNHAIGLFNEDIIRLKKAVEYLDDETEKR